MRRLSYCDEVKAYRDEVYRPSVGGGKVPKPPKPVVDRSLTTGKKLVSSAIESLSGSRKLTWALSLSCPSSNAYPVWVVEFGKFVDQGFPILPGEKFQFRVDDVGKVLVCAPDVTGGSGVEPQIIYYLGW
jgi:hypothetical protein